MATLAHIEDLIARTALRETAAFSELYDATSGKLFAICIRVLNNRSEAEEVLQEVYLRIWQKADTYAVTGHSPMTWLITIARNAAIDRLRQAKAPTRDIETVYDLSDDRPGPEASAIASSERARIHGCLQELEETRAEAVKQVYLLGETYKDIAARHGVPLNTMRTWLRRSLLKLRECLER